MFSFEMEGSDGSSGVYWMRTLRLLFHIGSVECVMCHFSLSHEIDGFLYTGGALAVEKVGGRSRMFGMVALENYRCHKAWLHVYVLHLGYFLLKQGCQCYNTLLVRIRSVIGTCNLSSRGFALSLDRDFQVNCHVQLEPILNI